MNPKFFRNGIVMLVLVVGTAALLFTWITTTRTVPPAPAIPAFLPTSAGDVTKVIQQGETLTGHTERRDQDLHRHRPERS